MSLKMLLQMLRDSKYCFTMVYMFIGVGGVNRDRSELAILQHLATQSLDRSVQKMLHEHDPKMP